MEDGVFILGYFACFSRLMLIELTWLLPAFSGAFLAYANQTAFSLFKKFISLWFFWSFLGDIILSNFEIIFVYYNLIV